MKPKPTQRPPWCWPYPQTWTQVYRDIATLLLGFLATACLLHLLKGTLP